jgi:hypothetical protein
MSLPPGASGGYLSGMSRASMRRQNDKLCKPSACQTIARSRLFALSPRPFGFLF